MNLQPQQLAEAWRLLEAAPRGQKTAIMQDLARMFGLSVSQTYTALKDGGWCSGRKVRADKGTSERLTDAELHAMSQWLFLTQRKTGKILGDIATGKEELYRSGRISLTAYETSDATWNRRLLTAGIGKAGLKSPSLATELDSRHPNEWHLVDASVGVLFYLDRGQMKFKRFDTMDPKNKPQQFAEFVNRRLLLVRWVLVDHYSGSFVVDYHQSTGETSADLLDFLHYAWSPKVDPRWPIHGVGWHLWMDQASAQKSAAVTALTQSLGVQLHLHQSSEVRSDAPAARATGGVEVVQRIWEHEFEVLWRSNPPTGGLEQIRRQAADYCVLMNSDPRYKLRRAGMTRSELWMDIKDEQLRLPPSLDVFRSLAVGRAESRVLDAYGKFTLDKHEFKLQHCTWLPDERVEVRRSPFDDSRVQVLNLRTGEQAEAVRLERRRNGRSSAAVYLGEKDTTHAHQPKHAAARVREAVAEQVSSKTGLAAPGAIVSQLEQSAELVNVQFVPRVGTPILATVSGRLVDAWDALELAVARLGELAPDESAWLSGQIPGRMDETEALALIEQLAERKGLNRQVLSFTGGKR